MKRFTLILALVLLVTMPTFAEHVSSVTAQKVATTFLNNNGVKSTQLTDLSKEAGFPNLYIFNANPGFVVMAADDRVQPILGYSLTGKFVAKNMPTNVSGWLQGYNDEIQYAIDKRIKATAETAKLWKDLVNGDSKAGKANVVVDALIQSTWDQDPGYNELCPYDSNAGELTVTGCVATAMAQIMRYWEYPSHGSGSHSYTPSTHPEYGTQSVNYAQATYDWTNMPLHGPNSEIAKLMYHCGVSVDMMYGTGSEGGSGAYSNDIPNALTTYFNYKSGASFKYKSYYGNNSWNNMIKTELNAGRPVEYNGSGSGGGHAFVCDGYDDSNYYHFNWGWSGANDGFYSLSNLVPGSGGSGGGSYSFTSNQSAVFGIQPKDCTAAAPTNLNVTLEGRTAVLTWNSASNAVSYFIYRDGLLIANTTNTTYPDTDLSYGTYAYYVKSVDSNGAKSSPTATVTVTIEPLPSNLTVAQNGDGAILNWTEPEWCMPKTDNEVLTYGDGSMNYTFGPGDGETCLYVGHKYPTSMLSANKVLYKVSFYASVSGNFTLFVYTGTSENNCPQTTLLEQSVNVPYGGWSDVVLSNPIAIDETQDLWVFIYDSEAHKYPFGIGAYEGDDNYGNYYSYDPYDPTTGLGTQTGYVVLIRTCITDNSFFYNLYDNNTSVATNLSGTSHTLASITNNTAHQYTLKTILNDGETSASNMAGLTVGTASLSSLNMNANDKMTVTEGSQLTVNGMLSDINTDNLILEDGAQLINGSNGVKATVKKNITAYSPGQDGGWHLIASPMTENLTASDVTGLLSNSFDLYIFNQSEELEWRNYETQNFTIDNKGGYLYANSGNPTLVFGGTLASNVTATELAYDNTAFMKGFNFIGNPYPCNTYVDRSFYVLNTDGSDFTLGSNPIPPCTAILVEAQGIGESVSFSKTASKNEPNIAISVAQANMRNNAIIDKAKVSFNENDRLTKYTLNEQHSRIYIPQNGQDFAVAYENGQSEMPINFKATQNGTYTLKIEIENLELDYLHLIDNLTGNDIDLLVTPSYTFEAKTTDYTSRFKLMLSAIEDGDDEASFAYYADGEIIINANEAHNAAHLQIVDMMGRVIVEDNATNRVSTSGLPTGVYVVRLINDYQTMTQKLVIR